MRRGAWLLLAAAVAYLAGVAVWVRYDRRSQRDVFQPGSVFNTGEEGLSLAWHYLRERAGRPQAVATLHHRAGTETLPPRAVLFRVRPAVLPFLLRMDEFPEEEEGEEKKDKKDGKDSKDGKDGEKKGEEEKDEEEAPVRELSLLSAGEEEWVRAGGRLVLAVDEDYGPLQTEKVGVRSAVRKVFPLWPGVSKLQLAAARALGGLGTVGAHAVILAGEKPILARLPIGSGDVVLLSIPEILQNNLLAKGDHLALLEALAGLRERRPVYFDERAHGLGEASGVTETLGDWGLGPLLLLAVLASLALFWRAAVRVGPPDREERDTRSEAVELLDSLADLYDRALGRTDALRLYHESFVHTLAAETGLRGAALEARARTLLEREGGFEPPDGDLSRERFDRALQTLNQAFRRLQDAKRK